MDFDKIWEKALKETEIIRSRVQALSSFQDTRVPYTLLCESTINVGDTVVRKGEVLVQKPSLILPPHIPQFEGFDLEDIGSFNENNIINFLLVRGISLPSLRYNNKTVQLDVFEGKMQKAIDHYKGQLQREENVHSGLVVGPEDCWQFSILIFICTQIGRNAESDIKRLLDDYQKRKPKE